jgi:hypothetical protein
VLCGELRANQRHARRMGQRFVFVPTIFGSFENHQDDDNLMMIRLVAS